MIVKKEIPQAKIKVIRVSKAAKNPATRVLAFTGQPYVVKF